MWTRMCVVAGVAMAAAPWALAQQTQPAPIAYVPTAGATVSGSLSVKDGRVAIGNNGTITAGADTAIVKLARGGTLNVCASTTVHLSRDTSIPGADSALMFSLNRGALEASYKTGKYSNVLMTPDFRILISGPGTADLKVRVNKNGDTCIDNHGANAPYVTVTSQFSGGLYRVQANQRVMFDDGSLSKVVDNEAEPCGCPAATPVAVASGSATAKNPFPLAQSEGLAPAPAAPTKPVVPVGQVQAEVAAPIIYSAAKTPNPEAPSAAGPPPAQTVGNASAPAPASRKKPHRSVFRAIGHFFARMFGK